MLILKERYSGKSGNKTMMLRVICLASLALIINLLFLSIGHGIMQNDSITTSSAVNNLTRYEKMDRHDMFSLILKKDRTEDLVLSMEVIHNNQKNEENGTGKQISTNSPIIVDLEISKAPRLNEIITVKLKINSAFEAEHSEAAIVLPEGALKVDGNLNWKGNLNEGIPVYLEAKIKFYKTGSWTIKGYAKHVIDPENYWGDVDYIYLNVTKDSGKSGF